METLAAGAPLAQGPVFNRERQGQALVLSPRISLGNLQEIEIARETQELLELLNHSGPTSVIIDLANCDYLGSTFLGAIVRIWKHVSQRGGRLALCNVSDPAIQILRVIKLHVTWRLCDSRDEALQAVGA
ncbi:MAG: anti-sigma factor antagonist [Planctomycetaceae bacterium]|nr:anti-sigma factor antagonist [Planctomycetaceae bacterium]